MRAKFYILNRHIARIAQRVAAPQRFDPGKPTRSPACAYA
jgi:hypothetical protein